GPDQAGNRRGSFRLLENMVRAARGEASREGCGVLPQFAGCGTGSAKGAPPQRRGPTPVLSRHWFATQMGLNDFQEGYRSQHAAAWCGRSGTEQMVRGGPR